jgi:heme exporter protein D
MDVLFAIYGYLVYGAIGLLILSLAMVLVIGIRNRKRWAFLAEFRDMSEREFGKFEIELSRNEPAEPRYSFKASLRMRHESLEKGQTVEVYLDDTLVTRGEVRKSGRILLRDKAVMSSVSDPREGQVCRVVWGGIEQFRAALRPD